MYHDPFSLLPDGFQRLDLILAVNGFLVVEKLKPRPDNQFLRICIWEVAAYELAMADFKWFKIIRNLNLTDRIYVLI